MLDKFYTNHKVAERCVGWLGESVPITERTRFIEPSAGDGDFLRCLPSQRTRAIDLMPTGAGIERADFFAWKAPKSWDRRHTITIGNPPFGNRGRLAVDFFNKAAADSNTVAFIVPMNFRKYFIHKQLNDDFRLVSQHGLPFGSFHLPSGKPYNVNTEFQVWTRNETRRRDLRLRTPPKTWHPDFRLYQYNNTREAEKVFKNRFDFAVPCQGYQDYTRRVKNADKCERNVQWMLIAAKDSCVRKRLWNFDFGDLAHRIATVTPGFRKNDLVTAYVGGSV
ncbi:MAG: hypothetical protein MPK62_04115 [Alphaproteobacteria bacterium]|nr:hypothetical protein [Alphaproteobacteria bacterium]